MRRLRRYILAILFALAFSALLMPVYVIFVSGLHESYPQPHGFEHLPWWVCKFPLGEVDTEFASDFTFAGLRKLRVGDSTERLTELCGEPIRKEWIGQGRDLWRYSISPSRTHHWQVVVIVNRFERRVIEKRSAFYFD